MPRLDNKQALYYKLSNPETDKLKPGQTIDIELTSEEVKFLAELVFASEQEGD